MLMNYLIFNITNFDLDLTDDTHERSGWTIHSVLQHHVVISEIAPFDGSSAISINWRNEKSNERID